MRNSTSDDCHDSRPVKDLGCDKRQIDGGKKPHGFVDEQIFGGPLAEKGRHHAEDDADKEATEANGEKRDAGDQVDRPVSGLWRVRLQLELKVVGSTVSV